MISSPPGFRRANDAIERTFKKMGQGPLAAPSRGPAGVSERMVLIANRYRHWC
jgi:hypothetical protein